jgi:hypothetical protein
MDNPVRSATRQDGQCGRGRPLLSEQPRGRGGMARRQGIWVKMLTVRPG